MVSQPPPRVTNSTGRLRVSPCMLFNVRFFFFIVLVQKYPCTHVNKAVNINTVRKRLQKTVLQCSESECNNNTLEVCKLYLLYLVIIQALIENIKFDKYIYIYTHLPTYIFIISRLINRYSYFILGVIYLHTVWIISLL